MNKNNQTSGCPSRSGQQGVSVSSQQEKTEQFVELVLNYQKPKYSISEEAREAVEEVLSESFPDDVVEAMMCLLRDADKQTIQRFA